MDDLTRARLLVGVDVLLTNPESLGNDALETDLYILRDQLQRGTANVREDWPAAGAVAGHAEGRPG